jgi:hypothetical protein
VPRHAPPEDLRRPTDTSGEPEFVRAERDRRGVRCEDVENADAEHEVSFQRGDFAALERIASTSRPSTRGTVAARPSADCHATRASSSRPRISPYSTADPLTNSRAIDMRVRIQSDVMHGSD